MRYFLSILGLVWSLALPAAAQDGLALEDPVMLALQRELPPSVYSPATDGQVVQWLKADALSLSDNDPVSSWTASTGSTATQGTGTAQPTFKTAIKNGLPVVRFDGTTDYLSTGSFGSQSQPYTAFIVFKYSGSVGTAGIIFCNPGGGTITFTSRATSNFGMNSGGGSVDLFAADNNWHIVMVRFNGASSTYRNNGGSTTGVSASGSDVMGDLRLGASSAAATFAACDIGEIIIRTGAPSVADVTAIFSYLNTRWAVY